jgi:predicted AlkP superfamily pyrophosphatase or phosphodiesterase
MRKIVLAWLGILVFAFAQAQTRAVSTPTTQQLRPKLVVGLIIDQMRYDYLYKYANRYGNNGFKKLLQGANCHNTFLNYVPTVTGCGHAGIYTGSIPALHGIASNDWYDQATGRMMYCAQDDQVTGIGTGSKAGKMSPKNLLATTIGDEIKLATEGKGKVVGISLKDRGAILPAGGSADFAFWMEDTLGHFVSSTWYDTVLPLWVQQFNAKDLTKNYLAKEWNTMYPIQDYIMSTADTNRYEGKFKWELHSGFPHLISKFPKPADIKRTPYGNTISVDFAIETIKQMNLGKDGYVDLLALSLSSTDYIGHMYGINSIEVEDCYYRLDKDIERLLSELDKQVGKGNYTLFLSADHGAAHNPLYLQDRKIAGGYFFPSTMKKSMNEELIRLYGKAGVADIGDNQIWINDSLDKNVVKEYVLDKLKAEKNITSYGLYSEIHQANLPSWVKEQMINGYRKGRSGDLYFILDPGYQDAYGTNTTGTTHGTWNPHDAHIPLLFYGAGIKGGNVYRTIQSTDIAATISSLLRMQMPNACIGECISEVLK